MPNLEEETNAAGRHRALSREEAFATLRSSVDISAMSKIDRWPSKLGLKALAQAVNDKLPFVVIDGKRFKIRYTTFFGGAVYISPDSTSIIPCGYFSHKRLVEALENEVKAETNKTRV